MLLARRRDNDNWTFLENRGSFLGNCELNLNVNCLFRGGGGKFCSRTLTSPLSKTDFLPVCQYRNANDRILVLVDFSLVF